MSIRTERVARLLQREIAELLNTEFFEESQSMATVTGVRMTKDLSIAYVHVSIFGDNKEQKQIAFKRLVDITPGVRSALAARIRHQMRAIPEIRFFLDESLEYAENIERLLERVRVERARREGNSEIASDDRPDDS